MMASGSSSIVNRQMLEIILTHFDKSSQESTHLDQ